MTRRIEYICLAVLWLLYGTVDWIADSVMRIV